MKQPDADPRPANARRPSGKSLCCAALLACGGMMGGLAPIGCSTPSARFAQCQTERNDLARRLAEEERLRRNSEAQLRQAMARLAESEKQLARQYDGTLAGRPDLLRDLPAVDRLTAPPVGEGLPSRSPTGSLDAGGWRPIRREETP